MPESIAVGSEVFADYIKVASLPRDERRKSFGKLSNEQKASFFKVQFALQFVKRPNMTKEQKDFILESISKTTADLYDKQNPQKAALASQISQEAENKVFGLFPQKDAFEILEGLGTNKNEEVSHLQKYEDLLKLGIRLRKKLVNEMPISERAAIWKTQLAYHLATSSLNTKQKEFIVEILPKIQSTLEDSANLSREEKNKYTEALESSAFKLFTKNEAFAVFMTIGIQKNVPDNSETLEQFKVGYTSQNALRSQTAAFSFPAAPLLSRANQSNPSKFSNALFSQWTNCACRWACEEWKASCGGNECLKTSSGCGFWGDSECTNACTQSAGEMQ